MAKFQSSELKRFLKCLDAQLSEPKDLILIGGAAASLAYGVNRVTDDIDTIQNISELEQALHRAREQTGLEIPLQEVGVWDGPYDFEDRLESLDLGFRNLRIIVPERHDLALMKVVRGQENDRDVISQMAETVGLDETILVDRFRNEMSHVIGDPQNLRANFLSVIEMLYGEAEADRIEAELGTSS